MKLLVAGASGFLGRALTPYLEAAGHEVTRLVRRPAHTGESRWDPYADKVDLDLVEQADVVVNIAGANIAHFPWTSSYQRTFRASRIETTKTLADAIASSERKPAFVVQNGIAGYGDRGDQLVTEETPTDADTFLGKVTRDWENATQAARDAGARVVVMRTAVVTDDIVSRLRPLYWLGLGGPISSGKQYFSTIGLRDWLRAATWLTESATASGPFNLAAPEPATNAEFTKALAHELHRPAVLRVPALPIKLLAPPVASDALGSVRLRPQRLLDEGFAFELPTIETQVRAALRKH